MTETTATGAIDPRPSRLGLSGKLLVLTILFVMIAEVLIYVPSMANFRVNWLKDRLASAHTAALVLDAVPPRGAVPEGLTRKILEDVGAKAIAMKMGNTRRMLASADNLPPVAHDYDMREVSAFRAIADAVVTLLSGRHDLMRVVGPAPMGGEFIETVMEEAPLQRAMWRFSRNILVLSLIISGITASLVYFALHYLFVRPMRRITANMMAFHVDPENPARIIAVSGRLGYAGRRLSEAEYRALATLADQERTDLDAHLLSVDRFTGGQFPVPLEGLHRAPGDVVVTRPDDRWIDDHDNWRFDDHIGTGDLHVKR